MAASISALRASGTSTSWSSGIRSASAGAIEAMSSLRCVALRSSVGRYSWLICKQLPLPGGQIRFRAKRSPINSSENRVEHRERLDEVGHVAADAHVPQRLEVHERRVAEVHPRGLRRAVGDHEAAQLAAR